MELAELFVFLLVVSAGKSLEIDLSSSETFTWRASLSNGSITVPGTVPGSIYSDLDKANYFTGGPLLYRFNDLDYRWVSYLDWDYSLTFDVPGDVLAQKAVDLVFYGVDTVADIYVNDVRIGSTNNMFVRYKYDVKAVLRPTGNALLIRFRSPVAYAKERYDEQAAAYPVLPECLDPAYQGECHANHIRKMQSSFSWDWGPAFPTVGLWHPVKLEAHNTATVRDWWVGFQRDEDRLAWTVDMKLHFETPDAGVPHSGMVSIAIKDDDGSVVYSGDYPTSLTGDANRESSVAVEPFTIPFSEVVAWMPNGWGEQKLYAVQVRYTEDGQTFALDDRLGFRTVELVEDDLPVGRTYYFRVNGEPVYLKGSNWIPSAALPEWITGDYLRELLTSASAAHMNAMRVWGGGLYEFDEFYRIADELGILIWHDMMYACSMYPADGAFLDTVSVEIRQQIRRLARHPSVLIWAGNNENEAALRQNWYGTESNFNQYKSDYIKLYVDTIQTIVNEEDPSRPYTPSSPSNGRRSVEEGYISLEPQSEEYGDVHYYNYFGDMWNWETYKKPRMATEYGFQALPSVHAWATAAEPIENTLTDDWHYDGALLDKRQHHPGGNGELLLQVERQLGSPRASSPERKFLDMIYLTQMHQAEAIKIETEHYRRLQYLDLDGLGRCMGSLYWQLQDIWQGPSWASIEYGGRWKPLHYFAVKFFAPLSFMLWLRDGNVAVFPHDYRNGSDMRPGVLQIQLFSWSSLTPRVAQRIPNIYGNSTIQWEKPLDSWLLQNGCTRDTCFLTATYEDPDSGKPAAPDAYLFLSNFGNVTSLQRANVRVQSVSGVYASERSPWTVDVTLSTDYPAAFVWLDTASDRAGRFSDNGFLLAKPSCTVSFWSKSEIADANAFKDDLTVTHLASIVR